MSHLSNNLKAARAHYQRFISMESSLNIDYHRRRLLVKALNKARTRKGAAALTGLTERTVYRLIQQYDILQDPRTEQYH